MKTFFAPELVLSKQPVFSQNTLEKAPELFQTLMVDPPWPYNRGKDVRDQDKSKVVRKDGSKCTNWLYSVSSESKYGAMSVEELCALGAKLPIAENAHLWLWYTNAFPKEAVIIAEAWGFAQKTIITWVKTNNDGSPSRRGLGHYVTNETEHMLFCVKGSLPRVGSLHPNVIYAPRCGHSRKPAKAYRLVQETSPGPWLEVFSRCARPGWYLFGDQIKPKST